MFYRYIFSLSAFFLFIVIGCTEIIDHKGKNPLVQIGKNFLYEEDVFSVIPPGVSSDDSTEMADKFIRNWIDDVLLLEKAEGNIPDNSRIDELVASYRKSLITHTYLEQIINQEVGEYISDQEIEDYYNRNKGLFLAEEPYIKGLYIKVPLNAGGISNVRKWYKQNSADALDNLEKYSLKNAVDYLYFYDDWKPLDELLLKCPISKDSEKENLIKSRSVEVKDTAFHYFIHIESIVNKGETLPLEYADKEIREILINSKRVNFISNMKEDLYNNAKNNNEIKYFNGSNE